MLSRLGRDEQAGPSQAIAYHLAMSACANCGTGLTGTYCSDCGQRASFHLDLHDFLHDATHEFLHFDSKIVRTFRLLLFKPGALTTEFVAGKRASTISPIRLYLVTSAIFFWIFFTFGTRIGAIKFHVGKSPETITIHTGDAAIQHGLKKVQRNPEVLPEALAHSVPKAMFLLMPISALLLWSLYRHANPYYVAHLYFAIHMHAFTFLVLSVMALLKATENGIMTGLSALLMLWIFVYVFLAQRRFYDVKWLAVVLKGAVSMTAYFVLLGAMMIGIVMLTLATV